jgi:TatD DNase family protein
MLVDAHAHLDIEAYDSDRSATIERAQAEGVTRIINVGLSSQNWEKSLELVRQYPNYLYLALGIHPNDISLEADPAAALLKLEQLYRANSDVIIGLGETGLDYYHKDVSPDVQQDFFERQIHLARKLDLPLIIHCRDAMTDLLDILERTAQNMPIMMHCFSGSVAEAERSMALGSQVYISIAGPVTFAKATDRHEVVRAVPLTRLLTETDCPFLTPHPFRGKRNEPARVKLVAQKIAELKNLTYAEVVSQTGANVQHLFRIT